jgi:hypothetical protein
MQRNAYQNAYSRYLEHLRKLERVLRSNPEAEWFAMDLCRVLEIDYTTWRGMRRWAMEHLVLVPWFGYRPGTRSGTYYWREVKVLDFALD